MSSPQRPRPPARPVQESVAPPRLMELSQVAEQLGISVAKLRDLARRGELPRELHVGHLLVRVQTDAQPEQLVAGTTRYKARKAQRVALEHFLARIFEPVVPLRSI